MNSTDYTTEINMSDVEEFNEFDIFDILDDLDMSSEDEFDYPESYIFSHGNITRFYWLSIHESSDEIPSETLEPTLSLEIQWKECYRRSYIERHRSEPTTEDLEVHNMVDTISDNLDLFLQAETSKIHFAELVSHMDIPPYCIESMALKLTDMAKKAHEVGKKMLRVVTEIDALILVEEDNYEEGRVAEAQRESMDLVYQGRGTSVVPASRSSVEALERMVFDKGESDEIKCTICLNEFFTGMEIIRMPCSHIFDSECIIQWLEMNHVCPLCRFQMPPQQFEEI